MRSLPRHAAALALLCAAPAASAQQRLTLAEAVQRAVTRSVSAVFAQQEILRAEGILKEARAPSLPQLGAGGAYTRLDSARSLGSTVTAGRDQLYASLQLSLPLIAPGTRR